MGVTQQLCGWAAHGRTGGGNETPGRGTAWEIRVLLGSGAPQECLDLIVDRCLCAAERAKGPGRPALRIKVVCSGGDLVETLQPAVLPNRTVSL